MGVTIKGVRSNRVLYWFWKIGLLTSRGRLKKSRWSTQASSQLGSCHLRVLQVGLATCLANEDRPVSAGRKQSRGCLGPMCDIALPAGEIDEAISFTRGEPLYFRFTCSVRDALYPLRRRRRQQHSALYKRGSISHLLAAMAGLNLMCIAATMPSDGRPIECARRSPYGYSGYRHMHA